MIFSCNRDNVDFIHWFWRKVYLTWLTGRALFWKKILVSRYSSKAHELKRRAEQKIKVIFLVNETSKWKYQQVYDLLNGNDRYDVNIVLTLADADRHLTHDERIEKFSRNRDFFINRKMSVVVAYDSVKERTVALRRYKPDIVFYQHPWMIADNQAPRAVSRYALTMYAPYYVPTYVNPHLACDTEFHRSLFAHFVINDSLKDYFAEYCENRYHAGDFFALGHPMVDDILKRLDYQPKSGCAIYAPHWSIPQHCGRGKNSFNLSTFLDYGEKILGFAKKHPEVKWIYKPHPTLYRHLIDYGIWSKEKTDAYYSQWEQIGRACYDGNYIQAFNESNVLITDCDSFLAEYALTRKPIVHLIGIGVGSRKFSPYGFLFDTYYRVKNETELTTALNEYVINGDDPNKEVRLKALQDSGLLNMGAAKRIVGYIDQICS